MTPLPNGSVYLTVRLAEGYRSGRTYGPQYKDLWTLALPQQRDSLHFGIAHRFHQRYTETGECSA